MADVGSVYEEKLSPTKPNRLDELPQDNEFKKDKSSVPYPAQTVEEIEGKEVPVPDEIKASAEVETSADVEATAEGLEFSVESGIDHEKCMDTVRAQGETINTLIYQLRIMFDEYSFTKNETEYYEQLNEALFRCLEFKDKATLLETVEEAEEELLELQEKDDQPDTITVCTQTEATGTSDEPSDAQEPQCPPTEGCSTSSVLDARNRSKGRRQKVKSITKGEMRSINNVLLREVFELRHQVGVLREGFSDYLNRSDEEEDDDSGDSVDGLTPQESYEILPNTKVDVDDDESDSD